MKRTSVVLREDQYVWLRTVALQKAVLDGAQVDAGAIIRGLIDTQMAKELGPAPTTTPKAKKK